MDDHAGGQPMSGRVALVAGASKGIGAATAEAFAAAGAAVVLAARDTTALKAVADGIQARGGRALAVGADVTDVDSVRHVVDQAVSAFGRLDAAFNNATAGPLPAPLADIDPDEFDLGIATNIRGTFLGMKFQIPAMLASGRLFSEISTSQTGSDPPAAARVSPKARLTVLETLVRCRPSG